MAQCSTVRKRVNTVLIQGRPKPIGKKVENKCRQTNPNVAQMGTMTPQTDTKRRKKLTPMLRARVNKDLKKRVNDYADTIERSESYVVRAAVKRMLDSAETAA